MIIRTNPADAPRVNAAVDGRIMFREERLEAILLTLAAGETMQPHQNPFDVLFVGVEGKARLITGESEMEIRPGYSIFVSADEHRGWENTGKTPCRVMVVKILQGKSPS